MPTANTFIPIVGSIAAPFAIITGDGSTVPRSGAANEQGDPRPGVLRWVLLLTTPDPTANNDDEFNITIPLPEAIDLDATIFANGVNSVFPTFNIVPGSPSVAAALHIGVITSAVDVANRTVTVAVTVENAASAGTWTLEIDFCHSAVN